MKNIWKNNLVLLLVVGVLASCQMAIPGAGLQGHKTGPVGSVKMQIKSLLSVARAKGATLGSASTAKSLSKAILGFDSAYVTLKDIYNDDVVDPQTLYPDSNGNLIIDSVPAGTGYTLTVSIYNNATALFSPVVQGSTTVDVTAGSDALAIVACLPVSSAAASTGTSYTDSLLSSDQETWYSVSLSAGQTYTFAQANSGVQMYVFTPTGDWAGSTTSDAQSTVLRCETSGTYYVGVVATSSAATSSWSYSAATSGTVSPTALSADDSWTSGNLAAAFQEDWYTVPVTAGKTYVIDINDSYEGDGLQTGDVMTTVYNSDLTAKYADNLDSGWLVPLVVDVGSGETSITIRVRDYGNNGDTGTYKFAVHEAKPLTVGGAAYNANLNNPWEFNYYLVPVSNGSAYHVKWQDSYEPYGSGMTCDVKVSAYPDFFWGDAYFPATDSGWSSPKTVTISNGDTRMFIKVEGYSVSEVGTYSIQVY